jgi:hypothetical protein
VTEWLVGAGVAIASTMTGAVAVWPSRDRLVRSRLRDRVVLTLKSGAAFGGVLFEADSKSFVLRDAEALGAAPNGAHLPVDGELLVARSEVEFVQRP